MATYSASTALPYTGLRPLGPAAGRKKEKQERMLARSDTHAHLISATNLRDYLLLTEQKNQSRHPVDTQSGRPLPLRPLPLRCTSQAGGVQGGSDAHTRAACAPRLGQVVFLYALYILLAAPLADSAALLAGGR